MQLLSVALLVGAVALLQVTLTLTQEVVVKREVNSPTNSTIVPPSDGQSPSDSGAQDDADTQDPSAGNGDGKPPKSKNEQSQERRKNKKTKGRLTEEQKTEKKKLKEERHEKRKEMAKQRKEARKAKKHENKQEKIKARKEKKDHKRKEKQSERKEKKSEKRKQKVAEKEARLAARTTCDTDTDCTAGGCCIEKKGQKFCSKARRDNLRCVSVCQCRQGVSCYVATNAKNQGQYMAGMKGKCVPDPDLSQGFLVPAAPSA